VGESGSGKSVTSRAILRLIGRPGRIIGGRILFEGRDLLTLSDAEMRQVRASRIAMVFQDPARSLNPTMRIGDQIVEVIRTREPAPRSRMHAEAMSLLGAVGILDPARAAASYSFQLSGGMRQRAMLAMALAKKPSLLIADEPTTALDVTVQRQILALIRKLRDQLGMATILITHDLAVAASQSDQLAVMYAGRIVESGPTRELIGDKRMPYTSALFGAVPRIDSEPHSELVTVRGRPPDPRHIPAGCAYHPRCDRAIERCSREVPALGGGFASRHRWACWNPIAPALTLAAAGGGRD
jgi:oligopeptide/dipeptide ABC transporter ATP-binding protein